MSLTAAYVIKSTSKDRNENDYYPTPPIATQALLSRFGDKMPNTVWEPAAGRGWISRELVNSGRKCISTDLYSYDNPFVNITSGVDYLTSPPLANAIVTNPPYSKNLAQKFVEKAISETEFCAFFVRLTFMESRPRHKLFINHPPSVLVFSGRMNCDESKFGTLKGQMGGMVAYAWFVWGKDIPKNNITWIDSYTISPNSITTLQEFIEE